MAFTVFLAVVGAALLHATWNALVKSGDSKVGSILVMTVVQGGIGIVVALALGLPSNETWPWLIASGIFHAAYKIFLAFAYEQGDLSRVYPIARGAAPILVLAISAAFLSDPLSSPEVVGIIILGLGITLMGQGAFRSGESRKLVPLALCSAAATAGYSLVDGIGARISGDALLFVGWLFIFDALIFLPTIVALRGRAALRTNPALWKTGTMAALASFGAYAIAVWAMTVAPIALVAALRETSILFAVLIGWLVFGDKMDRLKTIAAAFIITGVVATRL